MKRSPETNEKKRNLVNEINAPKSRLIQILNHLESMEGTKVSAEKLGNIIARLEQWQRTL